MSRNTKRGYSVPKSQNPKPPGIGNSQNGINVPKRKPEEHKDRAKPTK